MTKRRSIYGWCAATTLFFALCAVGSATADDKPSAPIGPAPSTAAATPGTGSLVIHLTVSDKDIVPEMVIYLSPVDTARRFPVPSAPIKLSQKNAVFSPTVLVVSVGQTVDFVNDEDRQIEHNIFSQSPPKKFDLGLYGPGTTKSVTFDEQGPVRLYCSVHRYMDGVIFVSPTPFFVTVSGLPPLDATIANVPPGEYDVKTWQKRKRWIDVSTRVTIAADKPASVAVELTRP